ncbi:hypothetical protein PYW07_013968 [Mythimna separata]|uniref:Uncharacterized protein n=1 Tax=Mythimna separata TaxID=271217 RepID=A0AAD8DPD4_MYTSE|nr:hypothetical protein PYW07_013968 [Mythimna separata]
MYIYFTKFALTLCTIKMLIQVCQCIDLIDIDSYQPKPDSETAKFEEFKPEHLELKPIRKYWLLNEHPQYTRGPAMPRVYEDEKDTNLKQKIANLVDQTMRDTQRKMKKTEEIKRENRDAPPYKIGFILCMIKKSKNVMDELFNVAVKHREQWKSLQHLKVFELIVHTNVDTTNLLRQLVDVHLKFMNSRDEKPKSFLLI